MTIKARATVYAFVKEVIADSIILDVNDGFDINTADGAQLDIIGKYVNAARNVLGVTIESDYFDMNTYSNVASTAHGFAYYTETPTSYILTYGQYLERTYRISDSLLRSYIKFKARSNSIDPSLKECDDIMFDFFGDDVAITDASSMSVTYTHNNSADRTLFQILAVSNSLPRPAGVGVTVVYT